MAQYVPKLEWSERALKARQFIFDFWAETGRGPNLRQAHLIHAELFEELAGAGFAVAAGDLGENITTRGVDLLARHE